MEEVSLEAGRELSPADAAATGRLGGAAVATAETAVSPLLAVPTTSSLGMDSSAGVAADGVVVDDQDADHADATGLRARTLVPTQGLSISQWVSCGNGDPRRSEPRAWHPGS